MVDVPSDWQTIEGDGYSVKCPANWKLDTVGEEGVVFKLLSPADDSIKDNFAEHVRLTMTPNEPKKSLKELAYNVEDGLKTMLANFEVTENKLYKDEAGKFQVTRGSGGLSVFMVSVENRTRIIGDNAYSMMGVYETLKSSAYQDVILGIMQSVQIK